MTTPVTEADVARLREALRPCPFCGGEVMHRLALWPNDGNTDAIIHAEPTECGMQGFDIGTADGGKSVAFVWNTRPLDQLEAKAASVQEALEQYRNDMLYPPAPDSRGRRIEMIDAALRSFAAPSEGVS